MKTSIFISILFFCIISFLSNFSKAEDTENSANNRQCTQLYKCALSAIIKIDDGISPANVIADAIPGVCPVETNICISDILQEAKNNSIKEDPRIAKEIEDEFNDPKMALRQKAWIKSDLLLPLVLKVRTKKNLEN